MRNYVKGFYGQFNEDSTSLGIHLRLKIWRHTEDEFWAVVDQLKADVAAAGGDWTGSLVQSMPAWFDLGDDFIQEMLKTHYRAVSGAAGDFDALMDAQLKDKSPRKSGYNSQTEKPK